MPQPGSAGFQTMWTWRVRQRDNARIPRLPDSRQGRPATASAFVATTAPLRELAIQRHSGNQNMVPDTDAGDLAARNGSVRGCARDSKLDRCL